ncbi:MAG: MBL fold metallo-hydrolase [Rhodothermales bacterium]|nr:MBL fold metallo-hydrolase [Rhodothermales bacterium]
MPAPVAAGDAAYRVKDLKITILSTMMTQIGVGEWGFSALIEADGHRMLFDTGLRPDTVLLNATSMRVDLTNVEEVVLSHNHGDHTGGLVRLRQELAANNERALRVAHVAPAIFWERPGSNAEWAMAPKKEAFEAEGGTFVEHEEATEIHPGIWLTGPVPRPHPEKNYGFWVGGEHRVGEVRSPDGLIDDDVPESMSMVINTEKGLVVISGCGHAGLINTLEHAADVTGTEEIHAAIGGFHLLQASDANLEWTANKLVNLGVENLVGAHCTGLEPVYRLRELVNLDRSTAVVGATGASFTLAEGIEALSLAR